MRFHLASLLACTIAVVPTHVAADAPSGGGNTPPSMSSQDFDVITTNEATALTLAKRYLQALGESEATVTLKECQFCHSEPLVMFSTEQQQQFKEHGGFILALPV